MKTLSAASAHTGEKTKSGVSFGGVSNQDSTQSKGFLRAFHNRGGDLNLPRHTGNQGTVEAVDVILIDYLQMGRTITERSYSDLLMRFDPALK